MTIPRARDIVSPSMNLVKTRGLPILRQLHLEEQLLRISSDNWCIINDGTSPPTIVTGISGKPSELIDVSVLRDRIPVIRRFSGGGTVIVDDGTIFVTLICNKGALPELQPYPRSIMSWTGQLYSEVLRGFGDFRLHENDYAFNRHKFGGNAQSITKTRWIHHTSFLWDYTVKNMDYLKLPSRAPNYRLARQHNDFLCRVKDYLPSRSTFIEKTIDVIGNYFSIRSMKLEEIVNDSNISYPKSTRLLTEKELEEALSLLHESTGTKQLQV